MMKNNKKIYFYPIIVEPQEEGGVFADCPTLQGCHAEGTTYGNAIENIQDVIQIHIAERIKNKDPLT
ncbi:type II toxin-antitoxin system HicB family antitoxin [Candidatus Parcubacteria bacterium]|nr:type II toxin-antitoxin system HicB family antitoxin [Candidatus Parcubacteria bacterium]